MSFERKQLVAIRQRLDEGRRFIQVIAGPRQVGKTTLIRQALNKIAIPSHYATADAQEAVRIILVGERGLSISDFLKIQPGELF